MAAALDLKRLIRATKNRIGASNDFSNKSSFEAVGGRPENVKQAHLSLVDLQVSGTYKFRDIPSDFHRLETAELIGDLPRTLLEITDMKGEVFSRLCKPENHEFVYMQLVQPEDWMNAYYATDYDSNANTIAQSVDAIRRARAVNKVEQFCAPFLKQKARVLDVGCGFGDQLSFFKQKGHDTLGLEVGETRVEVAKAAHGIHVINTNIEDRTSVQAALDGRKFKLIVMNQVLEHLRNPAAMIKTLSDHLTDDGFLFIAVPHLRNEGLLFKIFTTIHTHSFTATGLKSFMKSTGMELELDFHALTYNAMLFRKAKTDALHNTSSSNGEVMQLLERHFCLPEWREQGSGRLTQETGIVGSMRAVFAAEGALGNQFPDSGLSIHTNFEASRLLFK